MSEVRIRVCEGEKEERELRAPAGISFLTLLGQHGYSLTGCNGRGTCGRCRIRFLEGGAPMPTAGDRIALKAEDLRAGYRLACMHRVKGDCQIRVAYVHPKPIRVVTGYGGMETEEGNGRNTPYVTAVDLGTTTIAMHAVGADSLRQWKPGKAVRVFADWSGMNPQRRWGSDVISRMQAAQAGEAEAIAQAVRDVLTEGMEQIERQMGMAPERVCLAGNTTMEHLLLGLDTRKLGRYPFRPVTLEESAWGKVRLLPGISAFVGADVLAGLLACGFGEDTDGRCRLFIDLGTNGEMAIGNGDRLICTATAAGPAFEGGAGADVPGTDMVALLARLLMEGVIDHSGLLRDDLFEKGWQEGRLTVTQRDIRALQVAKAAVRAGVEILRSRMGVSWDDIGAIFLAGGFGYYLDTDSAVRIGLFPEEMRGRVKAVGNTSLLGAALYGGNIRIARDAGILRERAEVVNLAEEADFEGLYLDQLDLGYIPWMPQKG